MEEILIPSIICRITLIMFVMTRFLVLDIMSF
nr:MAG TPA: hypothetical protein [Caudoviricetes sp.]